MCKIARLAKKLISVTAGAILLGSMFAGTAFAEPSMPDLEITAITLGGTTLEIHLKNNGSSLPSDTEGSLYIWIDGSSRPEWTYSFSTLNDKNFLLFGGSSILGPQQLKGSHEVIACIDQTNLIAESNEANNCVVANVNGGMSLPDLRINSVTFNSSNVLSHLQMSVEIENIGKKDAVVPDGKLGLWYEAIDQGAAGFFELTGKDGMILSAGHRKTYTIPFNSLEAATDVLGSYNRFLFIVDQSSYINVADRMDGTVRKSEIDEANEANNSFVVQIVDGRTSNQSIVGPFHNPVRIAPYTAPAPSNSGGATTTNNAYVQPPDFTVDTIYLEFDTLKVDVRGGSPTPVSANSDGKIYIWIDDMATPVWTYSWKTLTDNQFLQGNGKHSLITPQALYGNHRVKACVDAEDDVAESYETNNCLTVNLHGNPVPVTNTNTNSSGYDDITSCLAPNVFYQGRCANPIPACQNPPAHFLPSSCIDKIENGQYIERYNFQCENGYVRSGSECVKQSNGYSPSSYIGFYSVVGNDDPYNVGDMITFKVEMLEMPNDFVASQDRGWSLKISNRYHFYGKKTDFDVPVKNLKTYFPGDGFWYITFPAPTPDNYDIPSVFIMDVTPVCSSTSCADVRVKSPIGIHYNVKNATTTNGTYTGSSSARTDGTVSVPPAGFEKDVQVGTQTQNNPFSDTNMATVAGKAAAALYNYGIIGGFPDGQFKGSRSVNRAEAAKFLLLSRYESVPDNQNNGYFYDVLNGEWYTKYVITAAGLGIIGGYGDGTFRPANTVNTAEFLKMLTLTFELETGLPYQYRDVEGGAWYAGYVGVATKYKLFPDRGSRLEPARLLTRNEVAVAIYQYLSNRD